MKLIKNVFLLVAAIVCGMPAVTSAQISVPSLPIPSRVLPASSPLDSEFDIAQIGSLDELLESGFVDELGKRDLARVLERLREQRIANYLRNNRQYIERDGNGELAVRGILVATGISDAELAKANEAGFVTLARENIEGLDLSYVRLSVPNGLALDKGAKRLRKIARDADITADNIYYRQGSMEAASSGLSAATAAGRSLSYTISADGPGSMGIIDGGASSVVTAKGNVKQRSFAKGGVTPGEHATAITSLLLGPGMSRGSRIFIADIYGNDPAGGNATAIAKALGWLAQEKVSVVTVSLTGPPNSLLEKAIRAAQNKGMIIVAAIGNDGPAASYNYPASYTGVLGVTGVDRKNKVLPEAGRATRTHFAARGSDIRGTGMDGRTIDLHGTSFAAPLVAARLLAHYPRQDLEKMAPAIRKLVAEAEDLGRKGFDKTYGNGLVCGKCVQ